MRDIFCDHRCLTLRCRQSTYLLLQVIQQSTSDVYAVSVQLSVTFEGKTDWHDTWGKSNMCVQVCQKERLIQSNRTCPSRYLSSRHTTAQSLPFISVLQRAVMNLKSVWITILHHFSREMNIGFSQELKAFHHSRGRQKSFVHINNTSSVNYQFCSNSFTEFRRNFHWNLSSVLVKIDTHSSSDNTAQKSPVVQRFIHLAHVGLYYVSGNCTGKFLL